MSALEIRPAAPGDDEPRDAFVRAAPGASPFHLAGWRRAVERCLGQRGRDLVAWEGDTLVGVLPLMECRGPLGGRRLISTPYAVYGGAVGRDAAVERLLHAEAERLALAERVGRLELRCRRDPGLDGWTRSELYATFARALPERAEEVLANMPKKARAEARKARARHGLELEEGPWYLPDLVRLFHANKRSLGSPGLPARFFEALLEELPGCAVVHLVRRRARPLAAVLSFVFRDQLLAYYSGTAEGADRECSASNFMYMALQEWAVERGLATFDFGRSRRDSGAFDFKVHQGFEPEPLHYRYRLVRDGGPPRLTPSNPRTRWLRATWSRLPAWLTTRLSGPAARYLP